MWEVRWKGPQVPAVMLRLEQGARGVEPRAILGHRARLYAGYCGCAADHGGGVLYYQEEPVMMRQWRWDRRPWDPAFTGTCV